MALLNLIGNIHPFVNHNHTGVMVCHKHPVIHVNPYGIDN